jgi:hypothetical protein
MKWVKEEVWIHFHFVPFVWSMFLLFTFS